MSQNISKGRGLENQEPSLPPYRSAGRADRGIILATWALGIYTEFEEWVCKILIKCSDISHCTVRLLFPIMYPILYTVTRERFGSAPCARWLWARIELPPL
jgi:hypothetical protein